jgi:glycosyltransferase involved in cell wall biosynthesis
MNQRAQQTHVKGNRGNTGGAVTQDRTDSSAPGSAIPHRATIVQVILPIHNEADNIEAVTNDLLNVFSSSGFLPRLLFVDDGSTDESRQVVKTLSHKHSEISYIWLSRNFGKEAALLAGMRECGDDFDLLAYMDADGQHGAADLLRLLKVASTSTADVVCGVRMDRSYQGPWQRRMAVLFYKLFRLLSHNDIDEGAGDFNVLRPQVVYALRMLPEPHPFMKGLVSWVGFQRDLIPITINERKGGRPKSSTRRMIKLALGAIISFSSWPLRLSSILGGMVASIAFLYLLVVVAQTLATGTRVPGYATIVVLLLGLGGIQLLCMGLLGEYVARIYDASKSRPTYIIAEKSQRPKEPVPPTRIDVS